MGLYIYWQVTYVRKQCVHHVCLSVLGTVCVCVSKQDQTLRNP